MPYSPKVWLSETKLLEEGKKVKRECKTYQEINYRRRY
jgi:hypothetical protein